jgi:hypothetical protein
LTLRSRSAIPRRNVRKPPPDDPRRNCRATRISPAQPGISASPNP